ncbi:stage II sporulation protein D [Metabacillus litoralis]|uniref:stage II sporulation protein D n=1 Tax=Metabacillus litoralis TaxID=152268 RepID=UPI00203EE0BC|nr:stage II sporulation protein D [Metabacillus litoralis]MCM3163802.1 stage II sporulation protein D [Metabacillus litoralis]MCM3409879.1 stage II sporulation protein D [Metabacillus litoralis]
MKPVKPVLFALGGLFFIILLIPTLLVTPFMEQSKGKLGEEITVGKSEVPVLGESPLDVPVYRSQAKVVENIPLEEYVIGVVASEMPAEFETEALKAQALAARTYITKQLMSGKKLGVPEGNAVVTDTIMHQVYKSPEEKKAEWGDDYTRKMQKITEAVAATQGQILTYDNQPIDASFFSTSNGYTENSEAVWQEPIPYLKSVESTWDEKSPKFYEKKIIAISQFEKLLGVNLDTSSGTIGKVTELTPGKRVAKVEIDGKEFTGTDVRDKLELKSADFTWEIKGDSVVIETKGYGHGVGMSQYGANFMAEAGKTYQDIVAYYYNGTKVSEAEPFLNKYTAKQ